MDDMRKSYNIRRDEDGQLETLDTMEQLKKYGVIGPCSFDGCTNMATARCGYKTTCLRQGGCDELYCPQHAHYSKKGDKIVCCQDCASQYDSDQKRRRVFITVGIIVGVVGLIFGIVLIAMASDGGPKKGGKGRKRWASTR